MTFDLLNEIIYVLLAYLPLYYVLTCVVTSRTSLCLFCSSYPVAGGSRERRLPTSRKVRI